MRYKGDDSVQVKKIDINNQFYIKISYHENNFTRYYQLKDKTTDKTITESYNRDSFLLKLNKIIKINNNTELLIASY